MYRSLSRKRRRSNEGDESDVLEEISDFSTQKKRRKEA
jgi:hypothetical protein